jgi:hypothetical protein
MKLIAKIVTPEESRDTEEWACADCLTCFFRERHPIENKWNELMAEHGIKAIELETEYL